MHVKIVRYTYQRNHQPHIIYDSWSNLWSNLRLPNRDLTLTHTNTHLPFAKKHLQTILKLNTHEIKNKTVSKSNSLFAFQTLSEHLLHRRVITKEQKPIRKFDVLRIRSWIVCILWDVTVYEFVASCNWQNGVGLSNEICAKVLQETIGLVHYVLK